MNTPLFHWINQNHQKQVGYNVVNVHASEPVAEGKGFTGYNMKGAIKVLSHLARLILPLNGFLTRGKVPIGSDCPLSP